VIRRVGLDTSVDQVLAKLFAPEEDLVLVSALERVEWP
jgi:hypothetical protein